jgi:hypothetical protein
VGRIAGCKMQLADGADTPRAASLLARVSLTMRGKAAKPKGNDICKTCQEN